MFILYVLYYFVANAFLMATVFKDNKKLTLLDVLASLLIGWALFPLIAMIEVLLKMHKIILIRKSD